MELFKTGGGRPTHKILDPMHDSILTLMNSKTVKGLNNMFDSDTIILDSDSTNIFTSVSNANNTLDSVTNSTMDHNNESDSNTEECCMYEVLEEDYSKEMNNTHTTYNIDVNSNMSASQNKKEVKKTKPTLNWRTYVPDKLKTSKHTALKVNESNTFQDQGESSKENETNTSKTITRRRRPSTMALNSSHISKQYSDLAEIKMELAKLQLIAQKEEMAVKQKQNEFEFELRKKSLELDIELKKAQLKRLQASSFIQQPFNIN
ncbi:PREDICTED: uncharacterized protein LOC108771855 [Cyphomyrmex costatus]|nr:PREDICTED: uncharacterized protein LOC108771855 [Cyphomyrmex costatus]